MKIPLVDSLNLDLTQPWKLSLSMHRPEVYEKTYADELLEKGLAGMDLGFAYHSDFGNQGKNFKVGDHVLGFIQLKEKSKWLLVTAGIVEEVPSQPGPCRFSTIDHLLPLCGRLVAEFEKGNTFSRYVFNLQEFFAKRPEACIYEILESEFNLFKFTGYADIKSWRLSFLESVLESQRFAAVRSRLEEVSGIYYILDEKTGKGYVGSAYGAAGLAQRWSCYVETLTGGNKKLKELTIGKNVTKVDTQAFYGCENLKKITVKSAKVKFGKKALKNLNKGKKVTVVYPKELKGKALKAFKNKVKKAGLKNVKWKKGK